MKDTIDAAVDVYKELRRRRKLNFRRKRNAKKFLKGAGAVLFVLLILWLIHDFIKFSAEHV